MGLSCPSAYVILTCIPYHQIILWLHYFGGLLTFRDVGCVCSHIRIALFMCPWYPLAEFPRLV